VSSWLVLDLRHNQCAVGLLTPQEQGPPTWYTEDLLDIYVSAETQDPRSVADLAFFRRRGQKRWKPAMSSVLRDRALADHEKVRALFDEPTERLPELLPCTLGILLRQALVQWKVPILTLLDRAEVQDPLDQFLSRLDREVKLAVINGPGRAYTGFALWDSQHGTVPPAGAQWFCSVPCSDSRQGITGTAAAEYEYRRYTWTGTRFSLGLAKAPPPGAEGISPWRSALELERVGAAMFALQWRDSLLGIRQVDVQTLQKEIEKREGLLVQLKLILQGLRGDGPRLPRHRDRGR